MQQQLTSPAQVDYNKLANVAKLSTKASANTAYCNVKKKLLATPLKPLTQRDTTVLVLSMQCLKSAEKVLRVLFVSFWCALALTKFRLTIRRSPRRPISRLPLQLIQRGTM